jgi:hypothetical protein
LPLTTAVLAAWVAIPTVHAQTPSPSQPPSAQTPPAPSPQAPNPSQNIPDDKLDATAAALKQVASLKQKFEQQMQAASPTEQPKILNQAKEALVKAVNDHGLSLEEYTSILVVAQNDPAVRDRILQRLKPKAE